MRLSRYVKQVIDFPKPGRHLLFNTLTHSFVEIDDATRSYAESPDGRRPKMVRRRTVSRLRRMGFLVPSRERDAKRVERYFGELKSEIDSVLQATVLTTFDCNFACTYCVEEGVIQPVYMDDRTARETADYIIAQAKRARVRSIYLMFYGGEPLLNREAIRLVAERVRRFAEKARLSFAFSITTNGALLTREVVDELVGYGLDGVKVTIDGNRACHNARRPFSDGSGSFDIILDHVTYAADRVRVDVGGNFDEENATTFSELLDILEERGLRAKLDKVSFKPISETPEDRRRGAVGFAELDCVYSRDQTAHTVVALRKMLLERGFRTDPGIGVTICGATIAEVHFTIDPNGLLYRCPAFVGHAEFSVGDILSGERGAVQTDLWRRCSGCENVAMCGDGCMYGAYIRYGDPTRLDCRRSYVDYVVQENLKTWYKELAANRTDSELDTTS